MRLLRQISDIAQQNIRHLRITTQCMLRQCGLHSGPWTGTTKLNLDNVQIRPMKREEMKVVHELVKFWGFCDVQFLEKQFDLDPGGYFCAELKDSKEIIGCVNGLICGNTRVFGSNFVVKDVYRGNGVGNLLQKTCCDRIGNRNISLWSIANREKVNLASGLVKHSLYKQIAYEGKVKQRYGRNGLEKNETEVLPLNNSEDELQAISTFDTKVLSISPKRILNMFFGTTNSHTYLAKNTKGQITGFIHLHPVDDYFRIYPWSADDDETAMLLFRAACQHVKPETNVAVECATTNRLVNKLAEENDWDVSPYKFVYMCSDDVPHTIQMDKMFACCFGVML